MWIRSSELEINKEQIRYLLGRYRSVLEVIDRQLANSKPSDIENATRQLLRHFRFVETLIDSLARLKFFKSLLRREEISRQILESHQKLTDCLALFQAAAAHNLLDYLSEMKKAQVADEESLLHDFFSINDDDQAVLKRLDVFDNQAEAMIALQTNLQRNVDRSIERQILEGGLASLQRSTGRILRSEPPKWTITLFDIDMDNDAILGRGGFGVVKKGTWGKIAVAMKELAKETDLKQLVKEIEGDLKEANILIDDLGQACISDFGLSKIKQHVGATRVSQAGSAAMRTAASVELGTLRYMSPEAMMGQISYASDIYAFGMTLYEIFTNEPPFIGVMDHLLFTVIAKEHMRLKQPTDPVVLNRGLTTEMWELIRRVSEPDAPRRPDFSVISGITEGLVKEWEYRVKETVVVENSRSNDPLALFFEDSGATRANTAPVVNISSLDHKNPSIRGSSHPIPHSQRASAVGTSSTVSHLTNPKNAPLSPKAVQLSDLSSKYAVLEDGRFVTATSEQARELAHWCLEVLNRSLRRIPAKPTVPSGASAPIDTQSPELQYACRHWAPHLACAGLGDEGLLNRIGEFMGRSFILWLEAASRLGMGPKMVDLLGQALRWSLISRCSDGLVCLLNDGYRFLLTHAGLITIGPQHVCRSALPFTPPSTSLHKTYIHEALGAPQVIKTVDYQWPACLAVLQGPSPSRSTQQVCVAFSSDGLLFANSSGYTIYVMDAIGGAGMHELKGHPSIVTSLAFSFDGTRMVSACLRELRVWNLFTGVSIVTINHRFSQCRAVAFSPDGVKLVTGWEDAMVRIWDVLKSKILLTLFGHKKRVMSVLFSPDGRRVASGSGDGIVCLWDATSGTIATLFEGHSRAITSLAFSHDGSRLVSCSEDLTERLWDAVSGGAITVVRRQARIAAITFLPRSRIASASLDMTVQVWDSMSGAKLHTSIIGGPLYSNAITSLAISPNGTRLVSVSLERGVCLWDTVSGILVPHPPPDPRRRASEQTHQGHKTPIRSMTFSPEGARLGTISVEGIVCLWDTMSGMLIATSSAGYYGQLSFLPINFFVTWENREARIWNVRGGEFVTKLGSNWTSPDMPLPATTMPIHDATPNGTTLATVHYETIHIWNTRTGRLVAKVRLNDGMSISAIKFSRDGLRLHTTDGQGEGRSYSVRCLTSRLMFVRTRKGGAETCESLRIPSNANQGFFMDNHLLMKARVSATMPEVMVCCIPWSFSIANLANSDNRHAVMANTNSHVAIGCTDGRVIILDVSSMAIYS
ncbi:hypothetical protein FRB97_008813 [Tulasnella sp. 331]|nr:hypothetical protein FRB97_008813 [Tulasnella sp. 331]